MSAIDRAALEDAVAKLDQCPPWGVPKEIWEPLFAAARAHLDALPRTSTIETWHLEYAVSADLAAVNVYLTKGEAQIAAARLLSEDTRMCVRVTGPHEHKIPA